MAMAAILDFGNLDKIWHAGADWHAYDDQKAKVANACCSFRS